MNTGQLLRRLEQPDTMVRPQYPVVVGIGAVIQGPRTPAIGIDNVVLRQSTISVRQRRVEVIQHARGPHNGDSGLCLQTPLR